MTNSLSSVYQLYQRKSESARNSLKKDTEWKTSPTPVLTTGIFLLSTKDSFAYTVLGFTRNLSFPEAHKK